MAAHRGELILEETRLGSIPKTGMIAIGLGLIGFVAAYLIGRSQNDGLEHFMHSYLVAVMFCLTISLGGLFFVLIQHLVGAGWSVTVRRLAELFAANIPLMFILFLPIVGALLAGNSQLYKWAEPGLYPDVFNHSAMELIEKKHSWLNTKFFAIRFVIYFAIWIALGRWFLKRSVDQDANGDPAISSSLRTLSAPGVVLFALSLTFFAFDFIMSLDPTWYSTIFGVYVFSGGVMAFLCCLALTSMSFQNAGYLKHAITTEHYHDIGKLLFAFVFFWGYTAYSQFMLIWYANIPEETAFFDHRRHGWYGVSMTLLFGHFFIPFVGLISRHVKRRKDLLAAWAIYLLVMHWVDLYWLIMPNYDHHAPVFHVMDALCLVGVGGIYLFNLLRMASKRALIPVKDPRLTESLAFHNM